MEENKEKIITVGIGDAESFKAAWIGREKVHIRELVPSIGGIEPIITENEKRNIRSFAIEQAIKFRCTDPILVAEEITDYIINGAKDSVNLDKK